MTDKTLLDGNGAPFTASLNLALGPQSDANSRSITLATIPAAALGAASDAAWASGSGSLVALLKTIATGILSTAPALIAQADEYETVAASQTDQVLGATGATGDRIAGFLINPATTSPGTVILKDGSTTIYTFTGGASSVSNLDTIPVPLGIKSVSGAFKITTGPNVSVIAVGDFT
jgi:hypothetical protein